MMPATPGSYGVLPPAYRLPDQTRPGAVQLLVSDLAESADFYEHLLGFQVVDRSRERVLLAPQSSATSVIVLHTRPGTQPLRPRSRLGLFHFAILVPDRATLGRLVRHASELGHRLAAGDHLVSEAFYLSDPDGLGIEVYADRPRDAWRRKGRELVMTTDRVDVPALVDAAGGLPWSGMPAETRIGHVHLHVADLELASAYYADGIGFDLTTWSYPGALFFAAGGYHHHLGTNTWAGRGATPPADEDARLLEWSIVVPSSSDLDALAENLGTAGFEFERPSENDLVTRDPWSTALRVTVAQYAPERR